MKDWKKRVVSSGLALALGITSTIGSMGPIAFAQDDTSEEGEASSLYEPWKHGYRLTDVLNWDASTDPFAEQLRARVPLQERVDPFAATQANPNLGSEAMVFNVASGNYRSTDVSNAPWNGNLYYDEFAYQAYKFWQYTDIIGAGGRPTSGIDRGTSQKEYGVIGIPIAAYTNAAHKNGAKAIAEYFFPRNPQYIEEWLYKDEDGNFPYAQKLVDLMEYYGFDGYFINNETDFSAEYVPVFKEMLAWMREKGVYIQIYDGITDGGSGQSYQNQFNSTNSPWVQDSTYGRVSDSLWINYFYYNKSNITNSVSHAQSLGLDPFESLFLGVEAGNGRFIGSGGNGASSTNNIQFIKDDTGNPVMSIALWGNDFTLEGYNQASNNRYKSQYQWQTEERERMWFTSPMQDPTDHTPTVNRPDVEVNSTVWRGISDYISERSVIDGSVFTTNFNNGHGMQYFQNGQVSRDVEWANMNIQDILPTWQWWVEGENKDQLNLDWDYGSTYSRILATGKDEVPFEYQQIGAYNGGSSLVTYGDLEGANFVNLYKTDLSIKADSKISITYNKPSADDGSTMQLGLVFKSAPDDKVYLPIEDAGKQTDGWRTVEISLGDYAGEDLAAFGVELASDTKITDYQVNFGQISVSDGTSYTPDAPENFKIDHVFDETGEVQLSWDLGDYDNVKQYNVYAGYADGSQRYVGGAYADNLYISTLEDRDNIVSLKLAAVGADGSESQASVINFNNSNAVSNIKAVSKDDKLNVTWDEADGDFASVKVTLDYFYSTKESASVTVNKGVKSAQLDIPVEDRSRYVLNVETVNADGSVNEGINYFGSLADNYCEPYDGVMRFNRDGTFLLTTPLSNDWENLYVDFDDASNLTFTRYNNNNRMRALSMPAGAKTMTVTVEDRYGNKSMPVMFIDGVRADLESELTAEFVPDDVLREAIKEKVGPTIGDFLSYTGELDLSGVAFSDLTGISLAAGVTSLNISGSQVSNLSPLAGMKELETLNASNIQITTLTTGMLPASLVNINLSSNEKLTAIEKDALVSLQNAEVLDITNNVGLEVLYLNGMKVTSINISGCDNISKINAANAEIDTLDLSGRAKLQQLELQDAKIGDLNLSGCSALEKIFATGADLKEIDITDATSLSYLDLNDSSLEKIMAADGAAYTNVYRFNFSGSRLDLSEGTPERIFVDAVGAYIEENPITPQIGEVSNLALGCDNGSTLFDGNTAVGGSFYTWNTINVDLGAQRTIQSWDVYSEAGNSIPTGLTLTVSADGSNYTQVGASVTGNTSTHVRVNLTEDQYVTGRYVRLSFSGNSYSCRIAELEINGVPDNPYGLSYEDQRPAAYLQELPEKVTMTTNKTATIRVKDYYDDCYTKAETVRGTLFSSLEGADWIAADYDVPGQIAIPDKVYVEIIDEDGNVINTPEASDTPSVDTSINIARNAKVLGGSGQNPSERYEMLFDGEMLTKWCTNGSSGWTAFYLPEEASIGKWISTHAEVNNEPSVYNTEDYELQILNTEAIGMTEDEFLASSSATSSSVLSNNNNWITIDHVTGNKSMTVDRDVEDAPEAKVYRLKINKSINGTEYAAVRFHELELYAADNVARDYDGVLALDQMGLYQVNFMKGKNVLASMNVRVKAVTSILESVIDSAQKLLDGNALDNTMEAVVTEFNAALSDAKDLINKEDATQAEINAATVRLLSVMAKVDWKQGDKTSLEIVIQIAQTIEPNLGLYVEAGKQEFIDALARARELMASGNAWDDDIKAATADLIEAMSNLKMAPNKDILNGMIEKANSMDLSIYTEESADAVRAALNAAQAVAADENADQAAIDAAADTLKAALSGLTLVNGGDGTTNNGTTTPVGDGTAPTKTGDMGVTGFAALTMLSAACVLFLSKKRK